jgi:hypothetical protein
LPEDAQINISVLPVDKLLAMHTGDEQHCDVRRRAARAVICTLGPPPERVRAPGYRCVANQRIGEPLRFGRRLRGLEWEQEGRKRGRHH